jgi:hypothetical protein
LKNIIVGCGGGTTTSIKEIEEQVRLHGSLKNSIQALKKEERDLMIRKQALESENDILSANNEGLKKAGENVTEIFKLFRSLPCLAIRSLNRSQKYHLLVARIKKDALPVVIFNPIIPCFCC